MLPNEGVFGYNSKPCKSVSRLRTKLTIAAATALSSPSDVISCIGPASHKLARHERDRLHLRNMSYLSRIGQSVCTQEAFRQRHLQGSFTLPLAFLQPLGLFLTAILCAMHNLTAPGKKNR